MQKVFLLLLLFVATATYAQRTITRGVYTVPNTSFHPDLNLGYANGNAGDGIAYADGGTGVRLVASVQLPHGAIIDSVKSYFIDYADPMDMYITWARYDNATSSGMTDLFTSTTFSKSSAVRSMKAPVGTVTVDNDKYSYYLLVQPKGGAWPAKPAVMGIRSVIFYYH